VLSPEERVQAMFGQAQLDSNCPKSRLAPQQWSAASRQLTLNGIPYPNQNSTMAVVLHLVRAAIEIGSSYRPFSTFGHRPQILQHACEQRRPTWSGRVEAPSLPAGDAVHCSTDSRASRYPGQTTRDQLLPSKDMMSNSPIDHMTPFAALSW
jgi:hypothetical protein